MAWPACLLIFYLFFFCSLQWCTPEGMLQDYSTGAVFLAPPQVYETSRLLNMTSFAELSQFACRRATEGCEQWMPVIASASDGALSLLPGQSQRALAPCPLVRCLDASVAVQRKRVLSKSRSPSAIAPRFPPLPQPPPASMHLFQTNHRNGDATIDLAFQSRLPQHGRTARKRGRKKNSVGNHRLHSS